MSLERKEILKWAAELEKLCGERATLWKPDYLNDGSFATGFRIDVVNGVTLWTFSYDTRKRTKPKILSVFGEWEGLLGRGEYPLHLVRASLGLSAANNKDNFHRYVNPDFSVGELVAREQWERIRLARELLTEGLPVC